MKPPIRELRWSGNKEDASSLLTREWLVTNGLGGYASGTVAGASTRRYHGLLIAALPAPIGRAMMLDQLAEQVRLPDGQQVRLGAEEHATRLQLYGAGHLEQFCLENGLPVWRYRFGAHVVEKLLLLAHEQNTVFIHYRLVEGAGPLELELRPAVHFRPHDGRVSDPAGAVRVKAAGARYELCSDDPRWPPLRMQVEGERTDFTIETRRVPGLLYRVERSRGYDSEGELVSPGCFRVELREKHGATLMASTESWETVGSMRWHEVRDAEHERRRLMVELAHPAARSGVGAELVLAADQFLIRPAARVEDAARASASGDQVRTVIAGYHWFTDWGRDTMISLEGLTLATGRRLEARYILRTFGHYIRDGLIPNLFPEGETDGLYHTADATLWFFHALHRYVETTGDRETLRLLLPRMRDILDHHLRGTRFGIQVDPVDGLLRQGAEGCQLTWMDAKVDGWVVTPRSGKAVEINALWYNALRLAEGWLREAGSAADADPLRAHADRAEQSFNRRFWYEEGGYLYDVVDGEGGGGDSAFRPNQLFALSLEHPVLRRDRWTRVVDEVGRRLLTPVGLRSLSQDHPDYKAKYDGDLRTRDAAYHQGTVWGWLIGPFVDAWLKVHPGDKAGARALLGGLIAHLDEACLGSVSEIFDAEPPFEPRGCIAQAWSVAEVLRCWIKTS